MNAVEPTVGRSPWTAADALVGLACNISNAFAESRTRGSGADEGVRPTKAQEV